MKLETHENPNMLRAETREGLDYALPIRLYTHPPKLNFCPGLETQSMTQRGADIPKMTAYKMRPKPTALAKYRDFDVSISLALMGASSTTAFNMM